MKKVYEIPEIAVALMETNEILAGSYGPWSDETIDSSNKILSREDDPLFFEDED